MLVARFPCPKCGVILRPPQPKEEGTQVRCPNCATIFPVSAPQEDEEPDARPRTANRPARDEDADRPARRSRRDEDDEADRPTRRSSNRDEDEDDRPARRSRRDEEDEGPARSKKKSNTMLFVMLGGGTALLFLVCCGGLGAFLLMGGGGGGGSTRSPGELIDSATAKLATIKDKATADSAKADLVKIGEQLKVADEEKKKKQEAMAKKTAGDLKSAFEMAAKEMEAQVKEMAAINAATQKLVPEAVRVKGIDGGKDALSAFFTAWGDGGGMLKIQIEMMKGPSDTKPTTTRPSKKKAEADPPPAAEPREIAAVTPPAPMRFLPMKRTPKE
jgi:hypothetical protein